VHAASIAARLGIDERPVRSLLASWWQWAGMVAQRGGVMDTSAFLEQREAEGLLELPRPVAERAIELDVALLHGRRAARQATPSGPAPAAAPVPLAAAAPPPRVAAQRVERKAPSWQPSQGLVSSIGLAGLVVLVGGGIALGQIVPHVPLPGGSGHAATDPYRAWIGLLAGAFGLVACVVGARVRPSAAKALRLPALGLLALVLFCLALLADASWLEYGAGGLFVIAAGAAWLGQRMR
jgi:hypothetical protein